MNTVYILTAAVTTFGGGYIFFSTDDEDTSERDMSGAIMFSGLGMFVVYGIARLFI